MLKVLLAEPETLLSETARSSTLRSRICRRHRQNVPFLRT